MIDNFSLLVSHGLILIACLRLLRRPDLDREGEERPRGFARPPAAEKPEGPGHA